MHLSLGGVFGAQMFQGNLQFALSVLALVLLTACGGGGSAAPVSSSQFPSEAVSASLAESTSLSSSNQSSTGAAVRLTASGGYFSTNAAPIFNEVFGGVAVEDQSCREESGYRISEIFDNTLQKYVFSFNLKLNDIDCSTNKSDRQRLEVKTYSRSPEGLKGVRSEIHFYQWKLYLPDNFQVSTSFTHLFQIKPVGGDDAMPLITLTARKANSNQLEILYAEKEQAQKVGEFQLNNFVGKWLDIRVIARYESLGSFEIFVNEISNGSLLLHFVKNLDLWREGTEFNRPKWGIYRSLNAVQDLKDETLLYDDFCISEVENSCW